MCSHDSKGIFAEDFGKLKTRLDEKAYTSIQAFNDDLLAVFSARINHTPVNNAGDVNNEPNKPLHASLASDQKELKKLMKRIIRTIQPHIDDALRKEADLARAPVEQPVDLETLLEQKLQGKRDVRLKETAPYDLGEAEQKDHDHVLEAMPNDEESDDALNKKVDIQLAPTPDDNATDNSHSIHDEAADEAAIAAQLGQDTLHASNGERHSGTMELNIGETAGRTEPLTPPRSEKNLLNPLHNGGIPWYLEPFDIHGTTVYEPIWAGREVLKAMSEDLSELDDDELDGLADSDPVQPDEEAAGAQATELRRAAARKRQRRSRAYR